MSRPSSGAATCSYDEPTASIKTPGARLEQILATEPELAHAWELYQTLHRIYLAKDDQEANQALGVFIDGRFRWTLPECEPLIDTLLKWGDEIFAFHDADRVTNGRLEGTNAKLCVLKRIGYGLVSATHSHTEPSSSAQECHDGTSRDEGPIPPNRAQPQMGY